MSQNTVVILSAKRTPMGAFQGCFSSVPATTLGAAAIKSSIDTISLDTQHVNEVFMGCVLPAGLGQAPARQAALAAHIPLHAGATTVNKVCGSGMKAVMLGHDLIVAGSADTIIAGGMESMSNAPYILKGARQGFRMGHSQTFDHMMLDGLENAYDGQAMGCFAQATADQENITREYMDEYALSSLTRAQKAMAEGAFHKELCAVDVNTRKTTLTIQEDEAPLKASPEKIAKLRPAFKEGGSVTAANASSISDGASALVLMREAKAKQLGHSPIAKIVGHSTHAIAPESFTVAPVGAIEKLLKTIQWRVDDVDLFEINEAFAMVTLLAIDKLKIDKNKVNIHGGACALGHPIGASGARILTTLIHALRQNGKKRGIASLCIGGGEATAMAVEV